MEFLLVIMFLSKITLLYPSINRNLHFSTNDKQFENEYIDTKLLSIINVDSRCIENASVISSYKICFNGRGNVNQAQTIEIINHQHKYTIHLGSGVYEIK